MEFISAKTILQKSTDGAYWFGIDYNMNLYKGCPHGCIYCDSRSDCYRVENFDTVRAKAGEIEKLESELRAKRTRGVVGIGAMSDTYNPFERE
ncbi:MAG: radical SAM protein, partial [Clostridiales bacterium]|nr:radical SAM protein [Clostridiales bacterium]